MMWRPGVRSSSALDWKYNDRDLICPSPLWTGKPQTSPVHIWKGIYKGKWLVKQTVALVMGTIYGLCRRLLPGEARPWRNLLPRCQSLTGTCFRGTVLFSTNWQEGTSTTLLLIVLGTRVPLEDVNQKSLVSVALLATNNSMSFITGLIPGVQFHYRG